METDGGVEKQKTVFPHLLAKRLGRFAQFPQARRRSNHKQQNRTDHLLQKPDISICYRQDNDVNRDIAKQRLNNQCITRAPYSEPADVVAWFGAMQAQDFPAAKWALGLRMPKSTEMEIDR